MDITSRQQKAIDTKWHIFNTAMEIFAQKPFDQVTIKELCLAAGVSTGAFYHHFQSKEHLLLEEYNMVDKLVWGSTESLAATGSIDRIYEYVGMYAQSAEDATLGIVTEVYRVWLTLRKGFPVSYESGVMAGMLSLVQEAQQAGDMDPQLDAKQAALDLLTIARGVIYHWCQVKGSFKVKDKAQQMVRPYLSYYSLNGWR